MFFVAAAVGGLQAYLNATHQDQRIAMVVSLFLYAPLLFVWCNADIKQRAIQSPPAAALLVASFALVGVPYYFVKTRPLKSAAAHIAGATLLLVLLSLVTVAAEVAATRVLAS